MNTTAFSRYEQRLHGSRIIRTNSSFALFQVGLDVPAAQVELIQDIWGNASLTNILDFKFDFSNLPSEARVRTNRELGLGDTNQSCAGFQIKVRNGICNELAERL